MQLYNGSEGPELRSAPVYGYVARSLMIATIAT